jgi:hypothetical protein
MRGPIPLIPQYIYMVRCLIKQRISLHGVVHTHGKLYIMLRTELVCSNLGGNGQSMEHAWERREIHTNFWFET